MRKERLKQIASAVICMMLCMAYTVATGEVHVKIEPVSWTWTEKENATFRGSVSTDGEEIKDAKLLLSIETRLEDSGIIQFTHLNGKKLKIRKRGPEVNTDLTGTSEGVPFEAEWLVPVSGQGELAHAVVTLSVQDENGKIITAGTMEMGSESSEAQIVSTSPKERVNQLNTMLLIACGIVWILALGRYWLLNHKARRKG